MTMFITLQEKDTNTTASKQRHASQPKSITAMGQERSGGVSYSPRFCKEHGLMQSMSWVRNHFHVYRTRENQRDANGVSPGHTAIFLLPNSRDLQESQ